MANDCPVTYYIGNISSCCICGYHSNDPDIFLNFYCKRVVQCSICGAMGLRCNDSDSGVVWCKDWSVIDEIIERGLE